MAPGPSSLAWRSYALTLYDAERAIVYRNTFGVARPDAVVVQHSGAVFISENQTPAGMRVDSTIGVGGNVALPEAIAARVNDALVLSL